VKRRRGPLVSGRRLGSGPIHRWERRTWPVRLVVCRVPVGWNECERCGQEHRIWMADDRAWASVPRRWRRARLCVRCFRVLVEKGGK
jgi:hypothetical protein